MSSSVLLVIGPVIGLLVARLLGPWRPLSAFAAAAVGQLGLLWVTMLWGQHRAASLLSQPVHRDMLIAIRAENPSLAERVIAFGALLLVAAVVTMLALGIQFLVTRQPDKPDSVSSA